MTVLTHRLEKLLENAGLEWGLRIFSPREEAAAFYLARLDRLQKFMSSRGLGENASSIATIELLSTHSPFRADAILEALISIRSPEIVCAAWRIIQGMTVQSLSVEYVHCDRFKLTIILKSADDEVEIYSSNDIDDLPFVRHLSKCKLGESPLLDGFHALRRK